MLCTVVFIFKALNCIRFTMSKRSGSIARRKEKRGDGFNGTFWKPRAVWFINSRNGCGATQLLNRIAWAAKNSIRYTMSKRSVSIARRKEKRGDGFYGTFWKPRAVWFINSWNGFGAIQLLNRTIGDTKNSIRYTMSKRSGSIACRKEKRGDGFYRTFWKPRAVLFLNHGKDCGVMEYQILGDKNCIKYVSKFEVFRVA